MQKPIVVVGSINLDLVARADHIPQVGETHSPSPRPADSSPTLSLSYLSPPEARDELGRLGGYRYLFYTSNPAVLWVAFGLALTAETMGRYLFFVSAVPKHLVAPYLGSEAA